MPRILTESADTNRPATWTVADDRTNSALSGLRVAIVHYWFTAYGGGERVIESLSEIFPQADIFALIADREKIPLALRQHSVADSFVSRIPGARRWYRNFLPLYPIALEQFDLSGYDLVISSESGPAKGVITSPQTCHICYCHSPMRYIWDLYHQSRKSMNPVTRTIFSAVAHYMRLWDFSTAARVDHFVANSRYIAARIRKCYRRESTVIHPPANWTEGYISRKVDDYYLVVSRLVPYKRVDLAIEACTRLQRRLRIVGTGSEFKRLQKMAGSNVEFIGQLDENSLHESYANCRALLFPGEEDFGIVPVEAQSHGRPVIAYGRGGVLETVTGEFVDDADAAHCTGVFFQQPSSESLFEAIRRFERVEGRFQPELIRASVERFGLERFKGEFAAYAAEKMEQFAQMI
jgi:glycosyltransferase involved in cell wall biosynthesis